MNEKNVKFANDSELISSNLNLNERSRMGPHGLGDPNDKTLRKVELEVSIPGIVRERAHREKCFSFVHEFGKCGEEYGFWAFLKCRNQVKLMNQCLEKWFTDDEFREECKNIYLEERSEYRQTGIIRKTIRRPYYINPEKEMNRIHKLREEYQRLEEKD